MEYMALTKKIRIYPNKIMRDFIKHNIHYRQECWNKGLRTWQHMYHTQRQHLSKIIFKPSKDGMKEKPFYQKYLVMHTIIKKKNGKIISYKFKPVIRKYNATGRSVRDYIIDNQRSQSKQNIIYPNEILSNTIITDLDQSFKAYFDPSRPDSKKPKIKKYISFNGSYLDTQAHIRHGRIYPTTNSKMSKRKLYSQGITVKEDINDLNADKKRYSIRFIHRDNKFYASIAIKVPIKHLMPTGQVDGVDANVDHFNSTNKIVWLSKQPLYNHRLGQITYQKTRLGRLYDKIAHYQKVLANKRECVIKHAKKAHHKLSKDLWQTKNYQKIRCKLRQAYLKAYNVQHDIVQQYTSYLVKNHDDIYIEDLDVKHMKMGIASKGLHRSLFGYFRQVLTYKCKLYGRNLHIVDKWYPSTQVCPNCGFAKAGDNKITLKGNSKHHTNHDEFVCYHCGYHANRDEKVPVSLMRFNLADMIEIKQKQKLGQDYLVF